MEEDKWIIEKIDEIRKCGYGEVLLKIHNYEVDYIETKVKEKKDLTKQTKDLKYQKS